MANLQLTAPAYIYAQSLFLSAPAYITLTVSALALEDGRKSYQIPRQLTLSPWPYFGSKALCVISFTDVLWSVMLGCMTPMHTGVLAEASSAEGSW